MTWAGGLFQIDLSVPEGDVTTTAAWSLNRADGTTDAGAGIAAADFKSFRMTTSAGTAAGWGLLTWTVSGAGQGVAYQRLFVTGTPTAWGVWPPSLDDLKLDLQRDGQVDVSDAALQTQLDAAINWVTKVKGWAFNLGGDESGESERADPDYDLILGTIRLAGRWNTRRRSPDGMVPGGGEFGDSRVSSFDEDIDRLLHIGPRHTSMAQHLEPAP